MAWAERVASRSTLLNPLPVVQWNTQKQRYQTELAATGIPPIKTCWLPYKQQVALDQLLDSYGWHTAVLSSHRLPPMPMASLCGRTKPAGVGASRPGTRGSAAPRPAQARVHAVPSLSKDGSSRAPGRLSHAVFCRSIRYSWGES